MNAEIPVHVDGEPWLQPPCAITILKSALKVFKFYLKTKVSLFISFKRILSLGNLITINTSV